MARPRALTPALPTETGQHDGLSYSLWLPRSPNGCVVILHGAGSRKENHHDFARAAHGSGLAAIAFDQRGHGDSTAPLDGRVLADIAAIGALVRSRLGDPDAPLALRGSSLGGYLAIIAGPALGASAVVAICPASGEALLRGLKAGRLGFAVDAGAVSEFLAAHDIYRAVESLRAPLLLLHAAGDERVPVEQSRELAALARGAGSRLIEVPGGHHRSIQHDAELQAASLEFMAAALTGPRGL